MGWLSKVWARIRAFFSQSRNSCFAPLELAGDTGIPVSSQLETTDIPLVKAPAETPAPVAQKLQPLDFNESFVKPGSPLQSPLKALLDQMEKAFPVPSIKPDSDMASLQYAAGQRAVVDWVRMKQKRGQA